MFASSLWIVLNAAFAQDPGPLVGDLLGPMPPATTLRAVDVHPEYIRLSFTTDRDFIVELTPRRDGASPVCSGGGADLYVRLDLNTDQESFDWEPLPPIVDQLCARMVDHPPRFPVSEKVQAPTAPPRALSAALPARLRARRGKEAGVSGDSGIRGVYPRQDAPSTRRAAVNRLANLRRCL